jgi:hypothetical protein
VEQVDKEFLVEEIRMHIEAHEDHVMEHIEHHEDLLMEHIEHHVTRHLSGLNGVIIDYEKHSRRRGWLTSGFVSILAITNIILIVLMLGGAEWIGTF